MRGRDVYYITVYRVGGGGCVAGWHVCVTICRAGLVVLGREVFALEGAE